MPVFLASERTPRAIRSDWSWTWAMGDAIPTMKVEWLPRFEGKTTVKSGDSCSWMYSDPNVPFWEILT